MKAPGARLLQVCHEIEAHPEVQRARGSLRHGDLAAAVAAALRTLYPGEQLRLYAPRRGHDVRERDRRICAAAAAAPADLASIARAEGLTLRRVQQIVAAHRSATP